MLQGSDPMHLVHSVSGHVLGRGLILKLCQGFQLFWCTFTISYNDDMIVEQI